MNFYKSATPLFLLLLLYSCNKDKTIQPIEEVIEEEITVPPPYVVKDFIIVGDTISNNIQFEDINPDISLTSYNSPVYHEVDLNSDGISDFEFKVVSQYPLAGGWFNGSSVSIKGLTLGAEVSRNPLYLDSAVIFPKQYIENDTLFQNSDWLTGEYYISYNGDDPSDNCFGPNCPNISHGEWFGTVEKYIGVRLNYDNPSLGWIKISLPSTNVDYGQTLIIEEYGFVP